MSLEGLFKKVDISLKNNHFLNALRHIAEIREKYPFNKRVDQFILLNKKKYLEKTNIGHEINNLQKEINNDNFITKLNQLLKLEPQNAYLHGILGDHHGINLNFRQAKIYQEKAISLNPFEEVFYINLSKSLSSLKLYENSLKVLKLSKVLKPKDFEINLLMARCLIKLLKYKAAFDIYNELILIDSNNIEISLEFCKYLLDFKETDKAIEILDKINSKKDYLNEITMLYGVAKLNKELPKEAKELFLEVLNFDKKSSNLYTLIGIADEKLNMYSEAIKNHKKAIELDPGNFIAYNNLAIITSFFGKIKEAITYLHKSIEINEEYHEGIYKLGQLQLYSMKFKEGWKNFESRWFCSEYNHKKINTNKMQLKEINKKTTLIVWSEQGIGDQIMYGSMFDDLSKQVEQLIVKFDERLIPVFKNSHPQITFLRNEKDLAESDFDYHLPFASIGSFIRNSKNDFLKNIYPYISGDQNITSRIKRKYKIDNKLLVGISWSSSNAMLYDKKSISLKKLLPILSMENINFIDLEYKDTIKERDDLQKKHGIKIFKENTIDNYNDIKGLTSIIEACDFVITCSNVNAHISGALNKKTFLLLPLGRGRLWNWSEKNGKSFWYPSVNILQQEIDNSWIEPINKLKEKLKNE